jgi:pimeloyl-ACP methyl ester carboxylesterase
MDRTLPQPRPDDLAHQDLTLPVGSPVPSLSDDQSPFWSCRGQCVPRYRANLSYKTLNATRASPERLDEPLSLIETGYVGALVCDHCGGVNFPGKEGYDLGVERFPGWRTGVTKLAKALVVAGAVGGIAVFNGRLERSGGALSNPLGGETHYYRWAGGDLAYAVAGEGEPLLLVHGIYAGASSFEFRRNFAELSEHFRVYALDLLGCGLSERPRRRYGPEDVTVQVEDFVREEIGGPAHLVASSLSGALSVPALVRSPRLFKRAVLVCPSGYGSLGRRSGYLGDAIYGLFLAPVVGDSLYHAIVSRRGIRYYLEKMAYHDARLVTGELVESYYRGAHQRGARYLPAAFVSGKLNLGVADYWPRVPHPTLVCWGQEARTIPVSEAEEFVGRNPRSEPRIFRDAALLPHDERAQTFNAEVREFLSPTKATRASRRA